MDFFTVPTLTFHVLYCFFVIGHDRRRVLHFNVTRYPSSSWIVQQLREAFPEGQDRILARRSWRSVNLRGSLRKDLGCIRVPHEGH